jgi:hypothetical protein
MGAAEERRRRTRARKQHGAALLITLVLIGLLAVLAGIWIVGSGASEPQRVQDTARAMGMIGDALIARAAGDRNRPGSLPCPDLVTDNAGPPANVPNDGIADLFAGSSCPSYVGRVPWLTLDLPDLRDAGNERFWYALSPAYRDHSSAGPLNSDTAGELTVSAPQAATDVVAIIFAPGSPLATQDRPANPNAAANYLEGDNANGGLTYESGPPTATFNDQVLVITRDMLMPPVEQRVARQARRCVENLAALTGGYYPFAALMSDVTTYADGIFVGAGPPPLYNTVNNYYGRIPSTLNATSAALGSTSYVWPNDDPQPGGPVTRCFQSGTWWDSWRELLVYRIAPAYLPSAGSAGPCGTCLQVNGQGGVTFVVVVAGRALTSPNQARTTPANKTAPANYLEQYKPDPLGPTFDNQSALISPSAAFSFGRAPRAVGTGPLGGLNDRLECVRESGGSPCN